MDSTKLPDLNRLNRMKKRVASLPPQSSALDTSNWESRNVSAPIIDLDKKIRSRRYLDFMKETAMDVFGLTEDQVRQKLKEQGLSPEQIQQRLDGVFDAKNYLSSLYEIFVEPKHRLIHVHNR